MKAIPLPFLVFALLLFSIAPYAQTPDKLYNAEVIPMVFLGESQPVRDYVPNPNKANPVVKGLKLGYHPKDDWILHEKTNPDALPLGDDPALQKDYPPINLKPSKNPDLRGFSGMGNQPLNPPDPSMDVGPNHIVQMINGSSGSLFQIWDKDGNIIQAAAFMDNTFGFPGGAGDPIVLYDQLADRWLLTEFSPQGPNDIYIAISTTGDPTGTYYMYTFEPPNFPDYPKYSVWTDAYIMTTNEGGGQPLYAMDRANMLAGNPATIQRFNLSQFSPIGFQAATPIDIDGSTMPPSGEPGLIIRMADDGWNGVSDDRLELYELEVDFNTPANSNVSAPLFLLTDPFDTELCGYTSFSCIQQPMTGVQLDPLREVIMNKSFYRNFGSHESIVATHVTDVNGSDRAGVPLV